MTISILEDRVLIRLYKNRKSMQDSIRQKGWDAKGVGSLTSIPRDKREPVELYTYCGVRLPTLVHECLHLATTLARRDKIRLRLGNRVGITEETLAYYQTYVTQEVLEHVEFHPYNYFAPFTFKTIKEWARWSTDYSKCTPSSEKKTSK